ncbi:hypothetical protein [Micromonospora sp. NPDC049891]|uniref:hypothetical protein n=1 Tax=Micromonospora sp. NPDC049891 TaxID=3155655 RepID=UPI0033C13B54
MTVYAAPTSRFLTTLNGTLEGIPAAWRVERQYLPATTWNPAETVYALYVATDAPAWEGLADVVTSLEAAAEYLVDVAQAFTTCDWCCEQATHRVIDSTDELICTGCLADHRGGTPAREYARKLTRNQRVAVLLADLIARDAD